MIYKIFLRKIQTNQLGQKTNCIQIYTENMLKMTTKELNFKSTEYIKSFIRKRKSKLLYATDWN